MLRRLAALLLLAAPLAAANTLVVYAYSESAYAIENAVFFLSFGFEPLADSDATDFVFVAQGEGSIAWPDPERHSNVMSLKRANQGAGVRHARASRGTDAYDYFVLINASVRGPFLPAYSTGLGFSWPAALTALLRKDAAAGPALVGTTVHCYVGPRHLHLQSMVLATDKAAMDGVVGAHLVDFASKDDAIYGGELPLSQAVLAAGLSLGALALPFHEISSASAPAVQAACEALRPRTKMGLGDVNHVRDAAVVADVHPLEHVFVKTNTAGGPALSSAIERYSEWNWLARGEGAATAARTKYVATTTDRCEG